ncbi:hypothetical protein DFH09DRAFT_328453 [Mycena vulgaris]|nr:hypothetical protein DFH09DRAFT_328453 [Mycena vulgaris]
MLSSHAFLARHRQRVESFFGACIRNTRQSACFLSDLLEKQYVSSEDFHLHENTSNQAAREPPSMRINAAANLAKCDERVRIRSIYNRYGSDSRTCAVRSDDTSQSRRGAPWRGTHISSSTTHLRQRTATRVWTRQRRASAWLPPPHPPARSIRRLRPHRHDEEASRGLRRCGYGSRPPATGTLHAPSTHAHARAPAAPMIALSIHNARLRRRRP